MTDEVISQNDEILTLEGGSEDEIRAEAARQWGVSPDEVTIKVVDQEKSFFGLFGRKLRAEVRPLYPCPVRAAKKRLETLFGLMDFDLDASVLGDDKINLSGYDSKRLIGRHGEGLKVVDYLSNLMSRSQGIGGRVRVDCDGYRRQREKELEQIALDAAQEAMKSKRTVFLEPMSSWERRLVRLALRESLVVETHSVGIEPHRKVAVRLIGSGRDRERPASAESEAPRRPHRRPRRRPAQNN